MNKFILLLMLLPGLPVMAQQNTVQLESTISGNQEQPKTIYVLPWQSPVSVIRIPGEPLVTEQPTLSPLDRQQYLRFIAIQQAGNTIKVPQSDNPQK